MLCVHLQMFANNNNIFTDLIDFWKKFGNLIFSSSFSSLNEFGYTIRLKIFRWERNSFSSKTFFDEEKRPKTKTWWDFNREESTLLKKRKREIVPADNNFVNTETQCLIPRKYLYWREMTKIVDLLTYIRGEFCMDSLFLYMG